MRRAGALVCCVLLLLISGCSWVDRDGSETFASTLGPSAEAEDLNSTSDPSYRDACTTTAFGSDLSAFLGNQLSGDGWTGSPSGRWLEETLGQAGVSHPLDVGSAFVLAHGIDGIAFLWLGPEDDVADLPLEPFVDDISTAILHPDNPHAAGGYRDARVLTTIAGGIRLWLLIHPRDLHERANFGPLPSVVPCLSGDEELAFLLVDVAEVASAQPIDTAVPSTAGTFAINTDPGDERDDPSIRYLGLRQVEAAAFPWDSANGTILLTTNIPPYETDSNTLSSSENAAIVGPSGRVSAGGIDLLAVQPMAGQGIPTLTEEQGAALQALPRTMNQTPFLGQT